MTSPNSGIQVYYEPVLTSQKNNNNETVIRKLREEKACKAASRVWFGVST